MQLDFGPELSPGSRLALDQSISLQVYANLENDSLFILIGSKKSVMAPKSQLESALASKFWIYAAVVASSSIPTSPVLAPFPALAKVVNTAGEPVSAPFGGGAVTKITGE